MKIYIRNAHLIEFGLFLLLIIITIFNRYRYGTILVHVVSILLVFILVRIIRGNIYNKNAPFFAYGCIWCLVFIFNYLLFKDSYYIGGIDEVIYISIFILFTSYFMSVQFEKNLIDTIFNVYTICILLVSLNILSNYFGGIYYVDQRASFVFDGVYKDPNYVASFIVPAMLWLFIKGLSDERIIIKTIKFASLMIMLLSVLATGSRAALVGILVSFAAFLLIKITSSNTKLLYRIALIILAIVGTLLGCYILWTSEGGRFTDVSGYMNNIRLIIWDDAFTFWKKSPLIGNGVGATSNYTLTCWYRYPTHNCFLDLLGDSGILGIICLFGFLRHILKKANDKHMTIVFICICLVPQMFINGFYTFNFWLMICLIKLFSDYYIC